MNKITQQADNRFVIPPELIGIRNSSMKKLINDVVDGQGQSYKLYFEVKQSSLPNHYDIRFFSTFSGAADVEAEQTKWKTTIPKEALHEIRSAIESVFVS